MYTLSNLNFMGKSPKIDPDAFVAPPAYSLPAMCV